MAVSGVLLEIGHPNPVPSKIFACVSACTPLFTRCFVARARRNVPLLPAPSQGAWIGLNHQRTTAGERRQQKSGY